MKTLSIEFDPKELPVTLKTLENKEFEFTNVSYNNNWLGIRRTFDSLYLESPDALLLEKVNRELNEIRLVLHLGDPNRGVELDGKLSCFTIAFGDEVISHSDLFS